MDIDHIRKEMILATHLSDNIYKMVIDESGSVGQGLMACAMAYSILAKCSPREVDLEELKGILDAAYQLIVEAEKDGEGHVLQ